MAVRVCFALLSAVFLILFLLHQPADAIRDRRICYSCNLEKPDSHNCSRNIQCFDGTWCLTVFSGGRLVLRGCTWTNPVGDGKCYHALNGEQWCYCGQDLCNGQDMAEEWIYSSDASIRYCTATVIPVALLVLFVQRLLWRFY